MYSKILVALDESQLSKKAFQQSLSLAQVFDAELQLLNVISPQEAKYQNTVSLIGSGINSDKTNEVAEAEWQLLVTNRLNYLESLLKEAMQIGITADLSQEIGHPAQHICNFAKDWSADLIVIGSHGRKGLNELFMGSVSNYVSHHVPCDVMLVHQQD
ncbi:universal stress protein [Pleurocapsales cyanobacterium LEGE 10410]|nr:universal stress protein [Pleurocapsales cyanobacterium LEGE 10410]